LGPGSTYLHSEFIYQRWHHVLQECLDLGSGGSRPTTVKPVITGASHDLWYFNGLGEPTGSGYRTGIALSSSGGTNTVWSVTTSAGAGRVTLSSTGGASITVTSSGSHFSRTIGDVLIVATVNGVASDPFAITTRTPWKLSPRNPQDPPTCFQSPTSYQSIMRYDIKDNFDSLIANDLTWNEVLSQSSSTSENGSNWGSYIFLSSGGNSDPLEDFLAPPSGTGVSPSPTCSGTPSGTVRYRAIPQVVRVGSAVGGSGVLVQTDTIGYYINHARHDSIIVPPQPPE
jgi:hypothetical protein